MPTKEAPTIPTQDEETVIAPGGPRAKSTTELVAPGQAVQGQTGGPISVTPIKNMKQDGTTASDTDLVLTPGGYRLSSLVHKIESGAVLDAASHNLRTMDATGKEMMRFGALTPRNTGKPLMPANVTHQPGAVPALGSGWICYAGWTENATPISMLTTTWIVPPEPATQSGQVVFLFNGIQNDTMILQPVLQWGPSAAGGGNYWSVACWYADGQNGHSFYTSPVRVSVGQVLTGVMTETGSSAQGYSYNCVFTGIANTSLAITNVQQLYWSVETLECYGIQKCSDYPATNVTAMSNIQIQAGGRTVTPAWSPTNKVTDCGQHAVVVSNASPGGEVDLFYNISHPFSNKVTLGDTSPKSPALATLNGNLFIAWKGDGNDNLNVMGSGNNGLNFGGKQTFGDTSPVAPTLCAQNGVLFLGWKGDGNDNLNVAQVHVSGANVTGLSNKVVLGDTSPLSPALASLNGTLFLAWKGDGNNNLNVMMSTNNGASFGGKFTSPETSVQAPGLTVHNGNLYITWKGAGNDNLNVALVNHSGNAVTGFSNKVILPDTSPVSPTLASNNGKLYLGWKGDGNDNLNVESSANNGGAFGGKYTSPETSPQSPCLCASNGLLFIAWKGDGNDNLNVARVNN
jgi:hypothetical protein